MRAHARIPKPFLFILIVASIAMATRDALGATPATKPSIPALVVGSPPPESFVVDGINRLSATGGLAFHVATDGKRQLCAVYDPADGTPLLLSDGRQTLIYDLANSRLVRVPNCRTVVEVDWDDQKVSELTFCLSVQAQSEPEKLEKYKSSFRIDRFVDETFGAMRRLDPVGSAEVLAAERKSGTVDAIQFERGDPTSFRFTSLPKGKNDYQFELHATKIGMAPPESSLTFPNPAKLPEELLYWTRNGN